MILSLLVMLILWVDWRRLLGIRVLRGRKMRRKSSWRRDQMARPIQALAVVIVIRWRLKAVGLRRKVAIVVTHLGSRIRSILISIERWWRIGARISQW